ncbi:MAG: hypothetical protein COA73_17490 [Candidatus Hydrogenedentota bacterium]|nr:MAG: hypothetical protein COA73_17490 [Candidatus Hydrogenedentota bacterium]
MAIVPDHKMSHLGDKTSFLKGENLKLLPVAPWIFAAAFLGLAGVMTVVPSATEFISQRATLFFYIVVAAFIFLGYMAFEARKVLQGMEQYEKNLKSAIENDRIMENCPAVPHGLEGLSEAVEQLINHVNHRHVQGVELLATNRILARELDRIFSLLHSVTDGVIALDNSGNIIFANPASSIMLNTTPEAAKGKSAKESLIEPEVRKLITDNAMEGGAHNHRSLELAEDEALGRGPLAVSYSCGVSSDDSALGQLIVSRDITQSKKVEKQQVEFIDNLAREIQSPLTHVKHLLDELLGEHQEHAQTEHRERCATAMEECIRIDHLISSLLNMSLMDSGTTRLDLQAVPLKNLLNSASEEARHQAKRKNVNVKMDLPDRLPTVSVDANLFSIALSNILQKSVKHTPADGTVTLSTTSNENELIITIEDTGCGMSDEKLGMIFSKYDGGSAAEPGVEGRTFGMTTSNQIIQLHGGEIRVSSVVGEGSRFAIIMPRTFLESADGE